MKIPFLLLMVLTLSCNSVKKTTDSKSASSEISMKCPEEGTCSFSVMENKSLVVQEDGIGMKYPTFKASPNTSIIKFMYEKKAANGLADGDYTEKVFIEVANDVHHLELKNKALQKVKVLYGRMCFCKGSTGYFKVTDGTLQYDKNKDGTATVSLVFNNNQVPQIIKKIEGKVSL